MIRIGIDPATAKKTGIAIVDDGYLDLLLVDSYDPQDFLNQLRKMGIPSDAPILLTIEGQEIYRGSRVKPSSILGLANRSGFFEGMMLSVFSDVVVRRPTPKEWKGQVSAKVYMNRILKKYGDVAKATSGWDSQETEDACHAYGLAIWGKK